MARNTCPLEANAAEKDLASVSLGSVWLPIYRSLFLLVFFGSRAILENAIRGPEGEPRRKRVSQVALTMPSRVRRRSGRL